MDWNGDGLDDIIVGDRYGYVNYFRRTGSGIHDLAAEGKMKAAGTIIDAGFNSAPAVVDWNNDGLLDLLIGNSNSFEGIRLYLNSGTTTNPVLTTFSYIQSNGADLKMYRCCPQVYDMNRDGKKDLIMGDGLGRIFYYENTGTDASPSFSGGVILKSVGVNIDIGTGARLCINDWDEDGLPDMIASELQGWFYIFIADAVAIGEEFEIQIEAGFTVAPAENPAREALSVNIQMPMDGDADIKVYDSTGRLVAVKSAACRAEEANLVTIDAGAMAAGVYAVVASTDNDVSVCRMILVD